MLGETPKQRPAWCFRLCRGRAALCTECDLGPGAVAWGGNRGGQLGSWRNFRGGWILSISFDTFWSLLCIPLAPIKFSRCSGRVEKRQPAARLVKRVFWAVLSGPVLNEMTLLFPLRLRCFAANDWGLESKFCRSEEIHRRGLQGIAGGCLALWEHCRCRLFCWFSLLGSCTLLLAQALLRKLRSHAHLEAFWLEFWWLGTSWRIFISTDVIIFLDLLHLLPTLWLDSTCQTYSAWKPVLCVLLSWRTLESLFPVEQKIRAFLFLSYNRIFVGKWNNTSLTVYSTTNYIQSIILNQHLVGFVQGGPSPTILLWGDVYCWHKSLSGGQQWHRMVVKAFKGF